MSTPATVAGARRQARWTREKIIERIQRWAALYDEPPRQADWNPSAARWAAAEWRIERYRLGDPETGEAWPSLNAAKRFFGGRFSEAVRAASFEPHRPGPRRRPGAGLRPAVAQRFAADAVPAAMRPLERELDAALLRADAAERGLAAAERRLATFERRIARAVSRADGLAARLSEARRERRLAVARAGRAAAGASREREPIGAAAARAEARAARVARELAEVRGELAAAVRRARVAERAGAADEARVAAVRDGAEAERRAVAAERRAAGAQARAAAAEEALGEAEARFGRLTRDAAAQELVAEARRSALAAEERAAIAERRMRELGALVTGEPRRLTAEEVERLRTDGPAGPALMAEALTALARARRTNGRIALGRALDRVATAAVNWKERL